MTKRDAKKQALFWAGGVVQSSLESADWSSYAPGCSDEDTAKIADAIEAVANELTRRGYPVILRGGRT